MERGASVELLSRSTGFDVLRDDAAARIDGADAVVEATGRFTTSRKRATAFFTGSTRAISAAARAADAKHVLLSIVNCELPEVQGYGYFAGKAAQERLARAVSTDIAIVRTTQWFEFAQQTLERMGAGPIALVPRMLIQPVALNAVAQVVADVAVGRRGGGMIDLSGPERITLGEMARRVRPTRRIRLPLALPGATWNAINEGALLPADNVEKVGPAFAEWLRTS
ncbi:3-beta hydroxysteroid dehydrogenase [Frondihabitans sp. PAMC 28766]|uniref:3-beta hydroxysteroid dehydrogenase n=1 Tax=Frondihabitans sp. PAMC 28766 TaxID=1795630 RepID=UPI0019506EEF|nr:3-beta hydroxysteroid dehydrogenase [Frondihabitans sp. PAMC 28766]